MASSNGLPVPKELEDNLNDSTSNYGLNVPKKRELKRAQPDDELNIPSGILPPLLIPRGSYETEVDKLPNAVCANPPSVIVYQTYHGMVHTIVMGCVYRGHILILLFLLSRQPLMTTMKFQ
jgi:hypothetical protein